MSDDGSRYTPPPRHGGTGGGSSNGRASGSSGEGEEADGSNLPLALLKMVRSYSTVPLSPSRKDVLTELPLKIVLFALRKMCVTTHAARIIGAAPGHRARQAVTGFNHLYDGWNSRYSVARNYTINM
ncbi:hypothetical protein E2562_006920 [Oryza meyeriana var. granulata]|uniref:Uncharacterized protein n=1 Tax=Oryza meyeriana var. granulata TaxID=110450 RepID=A0A6G1BJS8_9ORYZ|nr:hypothetical protein E2562_006920 [Oryza meyeriana var. granulata]